ncbi:MAG: nodulation protein NfeD, partial [Chloroflexota bacterium]|nr:nodulation protein NfeD [Chloroflexota bacterium]
HLLTVDDIINPISVRYLERGIDDAVEQGAAAVLIELSTPGGLLEATQDLTGTMLSAGVPVIVYVTPPGTHAASAGVFITMAGHVAVMAPGTRIGAATPISGGGEDIPADLRRKVMEDTQALLRGISEQRGRNVEWALTTVTRARSYTETEAIEQGGVDGRAATIQEALEFADGRTVNVQGQPVQLELAGAEAESLPMNPLQAFLHILSDPNIAFILFTIGFYGLIFELQSPNFVTGILGGIAIILAFMGFGSLPLNVAGLLLIALAIVLFILELSVPSHGLLTIAGIVCFALGAAALYTEPGTPAAPDVRVAIPVIVTMTVATAIFMLLVLYAAIRNRGVGPTPGTVGAELTNVLTGEVRRPLMPIGSVYAGGEEWSARAVDERPLGRGTPVRIVSRDGLILVVEPTDTSGSVA